MMRRPRKILSHFPFVVGQFVAAVGIVCAIGTAGWAAPTNSKTVWPPPIVLTVEGTNVWIQRQGATDWTAAYPQQILAVNDRGRTGRRSRTSIQLSDLSVMRIVEQSEFQIDPMPSEEAGAGFSLMKGLIYLLHRDKPGSHRFRTPTANAATRGTEFTLEVDELTGRTTLTVLEGVAELSNPAGAIVLATGEQGVALLNQPPFKTAVLDSKNITQWFLYYPAILDLADLALPKDELPALTTSLQLYQAGDVLAALAAYPVARQPTTDRERVYLAGLLLAVGQVSEANAVLGDLPAGTPLTSTARLGLALRRLVSAVQLRDSSQAPSVLPLGPLATELLAESYVAQAMGRLAEARTLAARAVTVSPQFSFGWTRVAELEFSHGKTAAARAALRTSLALASRNAQSFALQGFVFAAMNNLDAAIDSFEHAMSLDGGLANAWLGRGLCRIRRGDAKAGRMDLQTAAALEPQRALLRSYLGKAFSNAGDDARASKELSIAKELDANDPTSWLYSALLLQQQNRVNEAVRELEQSQRLNANRTIYRSRLLLDQDLAVRGANLAAVYRDAGLREVSLWEAGRAVNYDYANYSAHLFLANSYNQLRDPRQINLRYETAWFSEFLVANLLAPVGAGTLAQSISHQEYSKLLEEDGFGLSSRTEYLSHGEWVQTAAQFGTFDRSSYSAEVYYHTDNGQRPNHELSQLATVLNFKQQLTSQDSVYLRLNAYESKTGDLNQYFDQTEANEDFRTRETYEPSLLLGYHHEWSPGHHTLLLAGRLENRYDIDDPHHANLFFNQLFGPISAVAPLFYDQELRTRFELYTAEAQQIWQRGNHSLVAGARYQAGDFSVANDLTDGRLFNGAAVNLPVRQRVTSDFDRTSLYAYHQWQVWPDFLLVGGLSYDRIQFPDNYRYAPISASQDTRSQLSPKLGLILTPADGTTVRAGYFRGLGGVSLDQSVRLEPSQVAGFNQAYRSLIPESVGGANAAPTFTAWALSSEQRIGRATFIGLSGELLRSEVDRRVGAVSFAPPPVPGSALTAGTTAEELSFRERSLLFSAYHLIGDEWSVGIRYRLSRAELHSRFPGIPSSAATAGGFQRRQDLNATLQQLELAGRYYHPAGFFADTQGLWNEQDTSGYAGLRNEGFWQFNVEAGWRFSRRRAELRVALLNLTDQDYRLRPLNLASDLPRDRTLAVSLFLNF